MSVHADLCDRQRSGPGALTEEAFRPLIEAARHQQRIAAAKPATKQPLTYPYSKQIHTEGA